MGMERGYSYIDQARDYRVNMNRNNLLEGVKSGIVSVDEASRSIIIHEREMVEEERNT